MASIGKVNIVHESEAQRQYVRVKVPAVIRFGVGKQAPKSYKLHDLSAGGFSFDAGTDSYQTGEAFGGELLLNVDGIGFTIPVNFEVKSLDAANQRLGCVFQDLGLKEISALRQVITAYLGGELTSTGDMLATLQRENFVRPRGVKGGGLSAGARMRAVIGTAVVLVLGLLAFGYTVTKLYDIVFVAHATAAKVATTTYTITMPRDGTFYTLVEPGMTVKKGAPIGSFQTGLLNVVESVPGSFKLTPELVEELVGQQLRGSFASPCDCVVQKLFASDGQFVLRNQSIAALVPADTKPYLLARFHYDQVKFLKIGRTVWFTLNGEDEPRKATIARLRVLPAQTLDANGLNDLNGLNTNAAITDIIVEIEPVEALPLTRLEEPVQVSLDPLFETLRAL